MQARAGDLARGSWFGRISEVANSRSDSIPWRPFTSLALLSTCPYQFAELVVEARSTPW